MARINEPGAVFACALLVAGQVVEEFHDWPASWTRPASTTKHDLHPLERHASWRCPEEQLQRVVREAHE